MPVTISARPGVNGLITLAAAADRGQPLSPDGLVEYLLAAGRPRLLVESVDELDRLPAVVWAQQVGLCSGLSVRLTGELVVDFAAELAASWQARGGRLPFDHPVRRHYRLAPEGDRAIPACLVGRYLHPALLTDAVIAVLATGERVANAWGYPLGFESAARRPGGYYARLYADGVAPWWEVTIRYLYDLVDAWAGTFDPSRLDSQAQAVWARPFGGRP
jgi:hypothetical protein